jgi:hypothetical protein
MPKSEWLIIVKSLINSTGTHSTDKNLSPTKLVLLQDDVDWLSSEKIIDNLGAYFWVFDDTLPNPP